MERKRKDNSKKHPHVREQWMKAKRAGRPKQQWVWDCAAVITDGVQFNGLGHWERAKCA